MDNGPTWDNIIVRYAGSCLECGGRIEQGCRAFYSRQLKKIKHLPGGCSPAAMARKAQAAELLAKRFGPQPVTPEQPKLDRPRWAPPEPVRERPVAPPTPPVVQPAAQPAADLSAVGQFDSVSDLLADTDLDYGYDYGYGHWTEEHRADWYGLEPADYPEGWQGAATIRRIVTGDWKRGLERLTAAFEDLDEPTRPLQIRRVRRRSDQGNEVDITAYWRGRGDVAWEACHRAHRVAQSRVTIVCDAIQKGASSSDDLFWRGAAVAVLADKLSRAGYSVEVVSAWHTPRDSHGGVRCWTVVKQFHEPLDLAVLAGACACPAFFRAVGHAWANGHDADRGRNIYHGYEVTPWPLSPDYIVAQSGAWTKEAAALWVAAQIEKLQPSQQAA